MTITYTSSSTMQRHLQNPFFLGNDTTERLLLILTVHNGCSQKCESPSLSVTLANKLSIVSRFYQPFSSWYSSGGDEHDVCLFLFSPLLFWFVKFLDVFCYFILIFFSCPSFSKVSFFSQCNQHSLVVATLGMSSFFAFLLCC
jgi:hypothetical protein